MHSIVAFLLLLVVVMALEPPDNPFGPHPPPDWLFSAIQRGEEVHSGQYRHYFTDEMPAISPLFSSLIPNPFQWYNITADLRKISPAYVSYLMRWEPHSGGGGNAVLPYPEILTTTAPPGHLAAATDPLMQERANGGGEHHQKGHHHHHQGNNEGGADHSSHQYRPMFDTDVYSFCITLYKLPASNAHYQAYASLTFPSLSIKSGISRPIKYGISVGHYRSGKVATTTRVNELLLSSWGAVGKRGWNPATDLQHLSGLLFVPKGTPVPTIKIAIKVDILGFAPIFMPLINPPQPSYCQLWNKKIDELPRLLAAKIVIVVTLVFLFLMTLMAIFVLIRSLHIRYMRRERTRRTPVMPPLLPPGYQQARVVPQSYAPAPPPPPPSVRVYSMGLQQYQGQVPQQLVTIPLQQLQSLYPQLNYPQPIALQSGASIYSPVPIPSAPPAMAPAISGPAVMFVQHSPPPPYAAAVAASQIQPLPPSGIKLTLPLK